MFTFDKTDSTTNLLLASKSLKWHKKRNFKHFCLFYICLEQNFKKSMTARIFKTHQIIKMFRLKRISEIFKNDQKLKNDQNFKNIQNLKNVQIILR